MKHYRIVLMLASLLALSYGAVSASDISAWATNEIGGKIHVGDTFSVELRFYNDDGFGRATASIPLYFYSPNGSIANVVHYTVRTDSAFLVPDWRTPYPQDTTYDSSIVEYDTWAGMASWPLFHQYSGFSWDGVLPDTINGTFSGITGGWPPGDTTTYISFAFRIDELVSDPGIFCVDSCQIFGVEPAGKFDWLFEVPIPTFSGPYCWQIITDTTDVRGVDKGVLPADFELGQNYPNPFNPNTTFEFAVPQKSQVNISIFNILGQKISTIVDAEYGPGYYNATWDGTTDGGSEVASGIYFYKIEADNFKSTKKMMLLR
ncbi:MAG: T9SS type A sorting domain-containing protein [Candidatus Zixiibacteriota bacterium]|nr:MAG: T9SS type A sorting domain-containing protein [candidate division Zixibacteria bacterium]